KRVSVNAATEPKPQPVVQEFTTAQTAVAEEEISRTMLKLGIVITASELQYPYVQLEAVQGEADDELTKYVTKTVRLDLAKFINTEVFSEEDKMLLQQLRKLMQGEVGRYLNRNSPFSGIWENIIQQHNDELPEETRHLINEYLHPKFKKLFADLGESNYIFFLPP